MIVRNTESLMVWTKKQVLLMQCALKMWYRCESKFDAAEAKENKNKRTRKTVPSVNRTRNKYSSTWAYDTNVMKTRTRTSTPSVPTHQMSHPQGLHCEYTGQIPQLVLSTAECALKNIVCSWNLKHECPVWKRSRIKNKKMKDWLNSS